MNPLFKPMLAGSLEPPFILSPSKFPLLASPKLDGVRATVQNGVVYARSLKPIANKWVQELLGKEEFNGLDGELIVGDPTAENCFLTTSSAVGQKNGQPDFQFYVFDYFNPNYNFEMRLSYVKMKVETYISRFKPLLVMVPHARIIDPAQLLEVEKKYLEQGYEGTMIRSIEGPYKQGRSTLNEGYLLKLKRFVDAEAEVIEVREQMTNLNEAKINELGHVSRSSHKENKKPAGMVGSFVVKTTEGCIHKVSPGCLTQAECKQLWEQRDQLVGKILTYKYFPTGSKDKPRFPEFISWREKWDL